MSLKLNERYPGRFNNPSAGYPGGSFKNRTAPGAKDGSYLEQDWANDKEGFFQSLLSAAGITASGTVDRVGASQFFDALQQLKQNQSGVAFTTTGPSAALVLTPIPAIDAYTAPLRFRVKFNRASTGADTINISGKGPLNLKQYDAAGAKVAAVFAVDQLGDVEYDGTDAVLLDRLPVPAASMGVIGTARNLKMAVAAASASATLTADEIIVGVALGGTQFKLSAFNKTINLASVGAGGMDTGTAPVSGFVAIYAIYNPTTQTSALLARNATSAAAPSVYGGANMPAGYTASALASVRATNASSQFKISYQLDRTISFPPVSVLNSTAAAASLTSLSIAAAVPFNATSAFGPGGMNSSAGALNLNIASDANNSCVQQITAAAVTNVSANFNVPIVTAQTLYYTFTATGGSATAGISIGGYTI